MSLGPIQLDKFLLSGKHVPVLGDWHFPTYYCSHYRFPRQTNNTVTKTTSCQSSVQGSWWLQWNQYCFVFVPNSQFFKTVLTRETELVICSKVLAQNELCDLCFLTWPLLIAEIMTVLIQVEKAKVAVKSLTVKDEVDSSLQLLPTEIFWTFPLTFLCLLGTQINNFYNDLINHFLYFNAECKHHWDLSSNSAG